MNFADRLVAAVRHQGTPAMVGLDPRLGDLPAGLREIAEPGSRAGRAKAYRLFCREIIDVVRLLVPIVKPQAAFFEQAGAEGMAALADVVRYARQQGLLVVMDGKRNDIGSTATAYADAYLGNESAWGADALTVSPYLGDDSLAPFVEVAAARGAGVFVLVKTSNPGGGLFQDLKMDGRPLYEHVAHWVEAAAEQTVGEHGYGAVGAVVGATYPNQAEQLRQAMPHTWFLVPGFGAQGATARDVAPAFDKTGLGAVVNSSRGIIFAHKRAEYREKYGDARWQAAVEAATLEMVDKLRTETPAGKL